MRRFLASLWSAAALYAWTPETALGQEWLRAAELPNSKDV